MAGKQKRNNSSKHEDLSNLINERIENLRPKLLDLTRRNPLIATKFSDRSHSHVRIVDELINILFSNLQEKRLRLAPLPALEIDPKDENTIKFKNALADARLTDETYKSTVESIDQDSDDSAEKLFIYERELKDWVREKLGLHPRQTKNHLSLAQHAINHKIVPHYDLPLPENENIDGRHQDNLIQTLLLPDFLQKKLNSLMTKHRTWTQETGINVLRAAFGFLEWTESNSSKPCFAPLVLLPVGIEKKTTRKGFEYWVSGQGDSPEMNTVLAEKLKYDFGIVLPIFNPEVNNLEDYFIEVGKIFKNESKWRIRRQVAIGVFPSARMAMYHDLNTQEWDFGSHDIIKSLFGSGNMDSGAAPFADEYEIDSPKIESKVPLLVMDADSSQHSVIVDVVDKKSIAVEGPPGTGKSQTIVNTIAAALNRGKKVLFVAEKMAALEVVRSRLEACGMGEYLLTLQANRSSKEQVIQSIRKRLSMKRENDPEELDGKKRQFKKVRSELNQYIRAVSSRCAQTSFSVYEILGWGIAAKKYLQKHGIKQIDIQIPGVQMMNNELLSELRQLSDQAEECWNKASAFTDSWAMIKQANLDPYSADNILLETRLSAEFHDECVQQRNQFSEFHLGHDTSSEDIKTLLTLLEKMASAYKDLDPSFIRRVIEKDALHNLKVFLEESKTIIAEEVILTRTILNPLLPKAPSTIAKLAKAIAT